MGLQRCELKLDHAQRELQTHGTREFPCAEYGALYTDRPEDAIPWHWHEEIELIYVESGRLKVQIPEKTFLLNAGEGVAINSNILHAAVAQPSCRLDTIVFSPLLVAGAGESIFAQKYLGPLVGCAAFDGCPWCEDPRWKEIFLAAFEALGREEPGYEFAVRAELSRICLFLYEKYRLEMGAPGLHPSPDGVRLRKMLGYIHSRYAEELTLAQIAKTADIGERECLRCFRRAMQTSPMQYLLKYRVAQGASMLTRYPDSGISEVASRCGFDSPSNFTQNFKRFYRCTPRDYRAGQIKDRDLP